MPRYILKRVAYALLTLLALVTITFFLMHMLPGTPFIGDKTPPPSVLASMEAKYGLDKPLIVQYGMYLRNCLKGDLGISLSYEKPVLDIILDAFLVSADLGIRAIIFAVIAGVLLGALAAVKRGTAADTLSMIIAMVGVSVPKIGRAHV